ncbi:hydrogenase isoenzymes formation protein [Escherichia coli]|nr:hydrogenase isoenzymes formation protein [Escherichia coli]
METLKAVVTSMAETARAAGIAIVTGDTKVVQRGAVDKLFINTAGMGAIPGEYSLGRTDANRRRCIAGERYTPATTGRLSLTCVSSWGWMGELVSDCAVLTPLIQTLRDIPGVKALA